MSRGFSQSHVEYKKYSLNSDKIVTILPSQWHTTFRLTHQHTSGRQYPMLRNTNSNRIADTQVSTLKQIQNRHNKNQQKRRKKGKFVYFPKGTLVDVWHP